MQGFVQLSHNGTWQEFLTSLERQRETRREEGRGMSCRRQRKRQARPKSPRSVWAPTQGEGLGTSPTVTQSAPGELKCHWVSRGTLRLSLHSRWYEGGGKGSKEREAWEEHSLKICQIQTRAGRKNGKGSCLLFWKFLLFLLSMEMDLFYFF